MGRSQPCQASTLAPAFVSAPTAPLMVACLGNKFAICSELRNPNVSFLGKAGVSSDSGGELRGGELKTRNLAALLSGAIFVVAGATIADARPGDTSRHPICASFARNAMIWNGKAKRIGCRLSGGFAKNEGQYYQWCMGTDDASFRARSPQALGHKKVLEEFCTKQAGATINIE